MTESEQIFMNIMTGVEAMADQFKAKADHAKEMDDHGTGVSMLLSADHMSTANALAAVALCIGRAINRKRFENTEVGGHG